MWTAAAREICQRTGVKCLPIEVHGSVIKNVKSEIFHNNTNFVQPGEIFEFVFPLVLNNPATNYCKKDTDEKAFHRHDKHAISQYCEIYGINNPTLKCDLFLKEEEKEIAKNLKNKLGKFITIEPHSKLEYTPNRKYSFKKWQHIVNLLSNRISFVQVGIKGRQVLDNVTDIRGMTTFREAAAIIQESEMFISSEGGLIHAANSVGTKAAVVMTGYQEKKMVCYPENINIDISTHGPCGLKIPCKDCEQDVENHDPDEIVRIILEELKIG